MSPPKLDPLRKVSSQRLPPPALFQGPPSHNASNLSLPQAGSRGPSQPPPLQRNRSSHASGVADHPSPLPHFPKRVPEKGEVDGSEAIWQEMQSALSEVELSALTGEHVFGEKHSQALEDLRTKQLKLAQAWARSEADDEVVDAKGSTEQSQSTPMKSPQDTSEMNGRDPTENASFKTLDEETEKDILLARERREANDRYFDRVNNGVLDVVAKLEEVAQAMRAVQRESRDIWSDSDTMSATAPSSTHTG